MATTVQVYRPRAAVYAPRTNLALIAFSLKVEGKLGNAANFPNPGTIVTDLTAARLAFNTALTNKGTIKDVSDTCSAAKQTVFDCLNHAKDFVNGLAEKATPDQAKAIIELSGFGTRKVVVRTVLPIEVKYGGISGAVLLVAQGAGRNAVYYFQLCTDQKSWTALPNVLKCKTTATGLTVGTTYYFRVQTQTSKGGLGDWTSVLGFVVR